MSVRLNGIFYRIAIRPPLLCGLNCKALRNYCWNIRVAKMHVLKWISKNVLNDRAHNENMRNGTEGSYLRRNE